MHKIMEDIDKHTSIFKGYPNIAVVYLFGSYARGKNTPNSDLDLAIIYKEGAPSGRHLIHEEDYLAYRIGDALNVKEVDIINFNRQGLVFQHNVLKTGILIYDGDPSFRARYIAGVLSAYCDFEITLRKYSRFYYEGIKRRLKSL